MNETLDKTAGKILETNGTVPVGVLLLILMLLIAALGAVIYFQHKWVVRKEEQLQATISFDDSKIIENLSEMKTEISVGFKSLEKTFDAFLRMSK
jgi:uncharacterized protein HemX